MHGIHPGKAPGFVRPVLLLALALLVSCSGDSQQRRAADPGSTANPAMPQAPMLSYPRTATVDQVDTFFGTPVSDPYRWLEDDVRVNAEVAAWVEAQNAVSFAYLATLPERERIKSRLGELWNYERFSLPLRRGTPIGTEIIRTNSHSK